MTKTLQEILTPEAVNAVLERIKTGTCPVHWLVNIDNNPQKVRTACGKYEWIVTCPAVLLDPNRPHEYPVTCRECLEAMADKPVTVGVVQ